jgi:hypothetical protein
MWKVERKFVASAPNPKFAHRCHKGAANFGFKGALALNSLLVARFNQFEMI